MKLAAEMLKTLDDAAVAGLAAETLFPMLGGTTEQVPLVGTLADLVRRFLEPTDVHPLGRVTHKVARVYLGDVMAGRIPNSRRVAYTAIQHATALVVLEGYLWS